MKSILHLLFLLSFPSIFFGQTRDCDPIVMSGSDVPCMLGEAPEDVVAFRYMNGGWQQIPMQIDERRLIDINVPYGTDTGDCFYKSREPVAWDILFYTDPNTFTGADSTDLNFDGDDELVFMAKDVGDLAPQNNCPSGVVNSTRCQITVNDPLDNNAILGYVYVFRQMGSLSQDAGQDYVDYDFDFGADYKQLYDVCVFEQPGSNPESSRVTTDNYTMHFSRRWVKDELKIKAGNSSEVDILDHHQYFINVNSCNRNEVTFSDGKGPIIANVDGPVRAIRSVMGANSGTFMQLDILFTECRTENQMFYRLHPANGYYDAFDLSTNAIGMTFSNDQNTSGVTIDGNRDQLDKENPNEWELITGAPGSIVATYTFNTDLLLGTEDEYDQGLVEGFVAAYQSDLGAAEPRECTGDMESYNASGFCLRTKECTDNRYDFMERPNCAPEFVKFFDQVRYHYMLPPQTTQAEAAQYASFAKNPLTTSATAQNCGMSQNDCDPLNIGNGPIAAGTYDNNLNITATGIVEDGTTVTFEAQDFILLGENFYAEPNSTFIARIEACNSSANETIESRTENVLPKNQVSVYPNPFHSQTVIDLQLVEKETVAINVFDITGRLVEQISSKTMSKGKHQIHFDANHLESGIYWLHLQIGQEQLTQKLVVLE
ncbi:MAG: T9SS type A sorting domain-containing protein [Bacteroidota bacterium]